LARGFVFSNSAFSAYHTAGSVYFLSSYGTSRYSNKKRTGYTIPYLKDGDHHYYESGAIGFHLALKAGRDDLLGTNPDEKVRMAQIAGIIADLRTAAFKYIFGKKEDFDKE